MCSLLIHVFLIIIKKKTIEKPNMVQKNICIHNYTYVGVANKVD